MSTPFDAHLISTKEASELSGYNPDYLARLCRAGKIVGRQVGRAWVIDQRSLEVFVREQEIRKEERAQELSRQREVEYKQAQAPASAPDVITTVPVATLSPYNLLVEKTSRPLVFSPTAAFILSLVLVGGVAYAGNSRQLAATLTRTGDALLALATSEAVTGVPRFRIQENRSPEEVAKSYAVRTPSYTEAVSGLALRDAQAQLARVAVVTTPRIDAHRTGELQAEELLARAKRMTADRTLAIALTNPGATLSSAASVFYGNVERIQRGNIILVTAAGNQLLSFGTAVRDTSNEVARTQPAGTLAMQILDGYIGALETWVRETPRIADQGARFQLALGTSVLDTGGRIAYLVGTGASEAPREVQNLALGIAGNTAAGIESVATGEEKGRWSSGSLAALVTKAAPWFMPESVFNIGERIALSVYSSLHGVINRAGGALAALFGSPENDTQLTVIPVEGDAPTETEPGEALNPTPLVIGNTTSVPAGTQGGVVVRDTYVTNNVENHFHYTGSTVTPTAFVGSLDRLASSIGTPPTTTNVLAALDASNLSIASLLTTDATITDELTAGLITASGAINGAYFTAASVTATSSLPQLVSNSFALSSDYFTDLTGNGLVVADGTLNVSTTSLASGFFLNGGNTFGGTATLGTLDAQPLQFHTNNAPRLTIDAAGYVGIGTTSPSFPLAVDGIGYFTSGLQTGGDLTSFGGIGAGAANPTPGSIRAVNSISVVDGQFVGRAADSALSPSFSWAGDLTTGIFRPSGNSIGFATGGNERVRIDGNGFLGIGTTSPSYELSVEGSGYFTDNLRVGNNFYVDNGSISLGSATSTLTLAGFIGSNLIPEINKAYDIGSPALYWNRAYIDTLTVNNISAASTSIGGTASNDFTVNSDNATSDTEDMNLIFFRGVVNPNAVFGWSGVRDRFEFNQPAYIKNQSSTTTVSTLTLAAAAGQTSPILDLLDSSGSTLGVFTTAGNFGIGTTSPTAKLEVNGNAAVSGFFNLSTVLADTSDAHQAFVIDAGGAVQGATIPTQLTLKNTNATAGAYANEVHLRMQSDARRYFDWYDAAGTLKWNFGINAANTMIVSDTANAHRMFMRSPVDGNGDTSLMAIGTGKVIINGTDSSDGDTYGTGGFRVDAGGTYPRRPLFTVSSLTATDAVLKAESNGSGYAPASLLLTATQAASRGQGMFSYNTQSDTSWFTGVPYNVAGAKWMVGYQSNAAWDPFVADPSNALFVIQNNGKVGIGTTSPSGLLTVSSNTNTLVQLDSTLTSASSRLQFSEAGAVKAHVLYGNSASAVPGVLQIQNISGGGGITFINGGIENMRITAAGSVAIGTTSPAGLFQIHDNANAGVMLHLTNLVTGSTVNDGSTITLDSSSNLQIRNRENANMMFYTTGNERLRIDNSGNVGIGTTSPAYKFDVGGANGALARLRSSAGSSWLQFDTAINNRSWIIGAGTETGGVNEFGIRDLGMGATRLYINASGNMGIDTTTPVQKLTVGAGNILLDNTYGLLIKDAAGSSQTVVVMEANNNLNFRSGAATGNVLLGLTHASASGSVILQTQGTSRVTVTSNGFVGVGTTTPGAPFHLVNTVIPQMRIAYDSGNYTDVRYDGFNTVGGAQAFSLSGTERMRLSSVGLGVGTSTMQERFVVTGTSNTRAVIDTSSLSAQSVLQFSNQGGRQFEIWSAGSPAPYLGFGQIAGIPLMALTTAGSLGVGTSSPTSRLETYATASNTLKITTSGSSAYVPKLSLNRYGDTSWNLSVAAGFSDFAIDQDGTNRLLIKGSTGHVGIGTTTPNSKLHVIGSAQYGQDGGTFAIGDGGDPSKKVQIGYDTVVDAGFINAMQVAGGWKPLLLNAAGGRVGIGTTTPGSNLDIGLAGSASYMRIGNDTSNMLEIGFRLGYPYIQASDSISANGNGLVLQPSGGNVGIGTTTPYGTLSVQGSTASTPTIVGKAISAQTADLFQLYNSSSVKKIAIPSSGSAFQILGGGVGADNNFSFQNDSFTGLTSLDSMGFVTSRTTADIYFQTKSITRMIIDQDGNVGIGTTSPAQHLSVAGNSYLTGGLGVGIANTTAGTVSASGSFITAANLGNYFGSSLQNAFIPTDALTRTGINASGGFYINIDSNSDQTDRVFQIGKDSTTLSGGTALLTVQENGNVGIGTTSPGNLLEVSSGTNTATLVGNQSSALASLGLSNVTSGVLFRRGSDGVAANGIFSFNDTGGLPDFGIRARNDTAFFNNSTQTFTIKSSGNVGIGTTSPSSALSVVGTANANTATFNYPSGNAIVRIIGNAASSQSIYFGSDAAQAQGIINYANATNALSFRTNGNGAERLLIDSSGNIGIGTTSPAVALHVNRSGVNAEISVERQGQAHIRLQAQASVGQIGTVGSHNLQLTTNSSARLTIDTNGNVGIGTTTPGRTITVQGAIEQWIDNSTNWYTAQRNSGIIGFLGNRNAYFMQFDTANQRVSIGDASAPASSFVVAGNATVGDGYKTTAAPTNGLLVEGSVGIGTTSPQYTLHAYKSDNTAASIANFQNPNTGGSAFADIRIQADTGSLNLGVAGANVGTSGVVQDATYSYLMAANTSAGLNLGAIKANGVINFFTGAPDGMRMTIGSSGNVGIGTSTPTAQLHTTGTVRFSNFGSGSLQTDADGNVSVSSDERLKNVTGTFARGLADLQQLNPILYKWNSASGLEQNNTYAGFSAQNVQLAIPEAVDTDPRGFLTLSDRPILAAAVNAIKDLAGQTTQLSTATTTLSVRLSDIEEKQKAPALPTALAATTVTADEITADEIMLSESVTAARMIASGSVSAGSLFVPQAPASYEVGSSTLTAALPASVLTSGGQVDIYKLATYTLAAVQDLAKRFDTLTLRVDTLENRLAALESATSTPGTISEDFFTAFNAQKLLATVGVAFEQTTMAVADLVAKKLTIGTAEKPTGITMFDQQTGEPYCVSIKNGSQQIYKGACVIVDLKAQQVAQQMATNGTAEPDPDPDPVPQADTGTTASTTEPVAPGSGDTIAPEVSLSGDAAVEIVVGGAWNDPGATAIDDVDGDLTGAITVHGAVNVNAPGLYTVTYKATDAAGNTGQVSRTVVVKSAADTTVAVAE